MISDTFANSVLDTSYVTGDKFSLHTAFSTTGANEVVGGSYARGAATFSAAASRVKSISANVDITGLPANTDVAFVGLWNSAGTVFKGMSANGGTEKKFQIAVSGDVVYCENHGLANDDRIAFLGTPPTGITQGTLYYVVAVTAGDPDTLQVSATQGGAAVNMSAQPGAECVLTKVVVEHYTAANGVHRINTWQTSI